MAYVTMEERYHGALVLALDCMERLSSSLARDPLTAVLPASTTAQREEAHASMRREVERYQDVRARIGQIIVSQDFGQP